MHGSVQHDLFGSRWLAALAIVVGGVLVWSSSPSVEVRVFFHPIGKAALAGSSPWFDGGLVEMADRNLNSPFGTALLAPLGFCDLYAASIVHGLVMLLALVATAFLCASRFRVALGLALGSLVLPPACMHMLEIGQITPLIMLLFVLGVPSLEIEEKPVWAICLGVAAGMKLFVGAIALPLLIGRKWWSLGYFALGGLITIVCGALIFGINGYQEWFSAFGSIDWYHHAWNLSFIGIGERLGLIWAGYVASLGMLAVSGYALFWSRANSDWGLFGILLCVPTMVLCSPLGWSYYLPLHAICVFAALRLRWRMISVAVLALPLLNAPNWGYGFAIDTTLATFSSLLAWGVAVWNIFQSGDPNPIRAERK